MDQAILGEGVVHFLCVKYWKTLPASLIMPPSEIFETKILLRLDCNPRLFIPTLTNLCLYIWFFLAPVANLDLNMYMYICIYMYKGSGTYPCALLRRQFLTVENTTKKTQVHKHGQCVLLRLLWRPSREVFQVGL